MSKLWIWCRCSSAGGGGTLGRRSERLPQLQTLRSSPLIRGWKQAWEDTLAGRSSQLGADRVLSRTYASAAAGQSAAPPNLLCLFQSQRGGATSRTRQSACRFGWIPESTGELASATGRGPITVNLYVV